MASLAIVLAAGLIATRMRAHHEINKETPPSEMERAHRALQIPTTGEAFARWIQEQAAKMESETQGPGEVIAFSSQLSPGHRRQLLQTALRPNHSAAEKVLSAYMLVQAGERAHQELKELVSSPAQTEGEQNLRIMALDGLYSQGIRNAKLQADLAKMIEGIEDPQVKGYARTRFNQ